MVVKRSAGREAHVTTRDMSREAHRMKLLVLAG